MSVLTHIIHINKPYIKYKVEKNIHVFTVKLSDLIANSLEHQYRADADQLYFTLLNPVTEQSVQVTLKSNSASTRVYENANIYADKIIQLIVI